MLTAVSLFAGIGGIDLALQQAGVKVVAAVEIDPACRKILKRHFPHVTMFEDVQEVTGDQLRAAGFVPERGILAGGWPCTGNSVAGRREGMADPRSGLWRHVVRLLAELRPAWFLGENVPGLLSVNRGHDFAIVLRDLADLGMGFCWRVLDAQHFGVPQRRRRVIVVGRAGGDARGPVQVLLEPEGGAGHHPARREEGQDVAGTLGGGSGARGWAPDTDRMTFIPVSAPVTSKWAKGTGGPSGDETQNLLAVSETLRSHPRPGSNSVGASVTHALTSEGADASEDGTGRGTPLVPMAFNPKTGGDMRIGYGDKPTALSRTVETAVHLPTAVRRLTPLECERLQGFPDGWTDGQSDAARYRQLGNSVAVPCIRWVTTRMVAVNNASMERAR